jgi:hypothetical protein
MANIGSSANAAFYGDGIGHARNPGRANAGNITLNDAASMADQGLDQTAQRWAATTPRAVLATTVGTGSPTDTNSGVEFGQQALGNRDDAELAGQSMDRMLMQRAAGIGTDDGVS